MIAPKKYFEPGVGRTIAFLQARMGSTRLPGKVLMRIGGKSILERAISRLRAVPVIDHVAVLTTRLHEDDCIAEEAARLNTPVYRGPSQDVLRRYQEASRAFGPEFIVRATADNPLIDIDSVTRIVRAIRANDLDYCMEVDLPYGAATEICTAGALEKADQLARDPRHREHVTLYIKETPALFRISYMRAPDPLRHPRLRITVDTPEDFAFMERLIGQVPERDVPEPLKSYIPFAIAMSQERENL